MRQDTQPLTVSATYITIGLSVLLHGRTAAPLAERYARWFGSHPRDQQPAIESAPTEAHRIREPAPVAPTGCAALNHSG